jgi:UrcA family protein
MIFPQLKALSALLVIGVIGHSLPAAAVQTSATVSLAGLNLATDKGMQEARDRVHQKARRLCDRVIDHWSLSHQADYVHCVDDTVANAVNQLQVAVRVAAAKPKTQGLASR